jgi:hypothetical protein
LEIGIRHGHSLSLAKCSAIGVDPAPDLRFELGPRTRVVRSTSDEFFKDPLSKGPFDLIFIDGMHLFEYVLRDFINAERLAVTQAVAVIDDVLPNHPHQAARVRRTQAWTGDVWKIAPTLRKWRPDLKVVELDTAPTGLLFVAGLDPQNLILEENLGEILQAFGGDLEPGEEILKRTNALAPGTNEVRRLADAVPRRRFGGIFARYLGR